MGTEQSSEKKLWANKSLECALYATKGHRKGMEDAHVMSFILPHHPSYSLFGVFDGFNGNDASSYFAEHITNVLDAIKDLDDDDAIIKAVCEMDQRYIHSQSNPKCGCTFVFAVINTVDWPDILIDLSLRPRASLTPCAYSNSVLSGNTDFTEPPSICTTSALDRPCCVRVFWAGHARAVLMSDSGHFQRLTHDHNCTLKEEANRIVNANGTIVNNRLDGIVQVTRGFGCRAMKSDASLASDKQKMICVPEHTTVMCGNLDRLLLFCDGLNEPWTDEQLNVRYKHHVERHKDEALGGLNALKYFCEQAMDEGSKDNITALSIKFKSS